MMSLAVQISGKSLTRGVRRVGTIVLPNDGWERTSSDGGRLNKNFHGLDVHNVVSTCSTKICFLEMILHQQVKTPKDDLGVSKNCTRYLEEQFLVEDPFKMMPYYILKYGEAICICTCVLVFVFCLHT